MDPDELTILVSTLAVAISKNTPDDNELAQIAVIVDYLSDSLAAIVAQRALTQKGNAPVEAIVAIQE